MALDKLTKIDGGGISTTSDYRVGVITATKFVGPVEGSITATDASFSGNVTIGGTLTYEDVTNIDSVGIITARDGFKVLGGGANIVGVVTATSADINGDLDVDGHTNLDNLSIAGVTTFSNTVHVGTGVTIETNGNSNFVGVSSIGTGATGAVYLYNPDADNLSGTTNDAYGWKAKTYASGLQVNSAIYLSRSGANGLALSYNNATGSYINAFSGFLRINVLYGGAINLDANDVYVRDRLANETFARFSKNNSTSVSLYNNNVLKFNTADSGVNIVGTTTTTQLAVTGVSTFTGDTAISGSLQIADTIQHEGDVNTKIRFPAADTITAETGGSERLRIASDGSIYGGGTPLTESDLNWGHDTYQRPHIFSGITGGTPSDGAIVSASVTENPSNTRIGAFIFGCKTSSSSGVSNSGLKAYIECYTNTNVSDAWKTGGYIKFSTRPDNGNPAERLRIDSSGHLLHGVTADEDTSGSGGVRFINAGDIQIDGDQKALVFRSTGSTAQLQSGIEWWNENGAGVQAKIVCDRTSVTYAPSDLVFYTNTNVDTSANNSEGDITERLRIDSVGQVLPGADDAQNLGSSTKRWKNIYAADMHFSNQGKTNDVDGTWGDWTLQEGEDSVFMINNRTGKKYAITMKEVN